jgi:hypothetical protein
LFCVIFTLTLIQLNNVIDKGIRRELVNTGVLMIGLIFNLTTISDKYRAFIYEVTEKYGNQLVEIHSEFIMKFSFKNEIDENAKTFKLVKKIWGRGNIKDRFKLVFLICIAILFICLSIFLTLSECCSRT